MQTSEASSEKELTARLTEAALGYQRMLQENPCQPKALVGMTLVALASRQPAAAVKMARAALALEPRMGAGWVVLGQALKADGRNEEAERAYRQALSMDGMNAQARTGLGELMLVTDRPKEAIKEFELALCKQPALAAAHMGLGHALAMLGRYEEALSRYEQTQALCPRAAEVHFSAAYALAHLGKMKESEKRYRMALSLRPNFAAAWMNLGSLLREQGQELYAEAALKRAVELRPDLISGWVNLALLERQRKCPEQAENYLRKAFSLNPDQVETLVAWCQFRAAEGDQAGAWGWLRWALARDPENMEAVNMHGILLHNESRFEEALPVFEQAEALGHRAAASNRGNSLLDLDRMDEALRAQELAVERDPASPGSAIQSGAYPPAPGRLGTWLAGLRGSLALSRGASRPHDFPPAPLAWARPSKDAGFCFTPSRDWATVIQFCRYAAMVAARGGDIILQVREPVWRLMASLAVVHTGQAVLAQLGIEPPAFDLECPLMSLPAVFGTTVETVPWPGAYLGADPGLVLDKRTQFPSIHSEERSAKKQLRVGIAWAGNPRYRADQRRSTELATLLPLLRTPGITWISLQKGPAAEQLADLPGDVSVWDGSSSEADLAEAAALIATLDLVITTDTCIAHLAGAMAKPVWILLPHLSDWRWMQKIETTPWYPTARLFRQRTPGDWAGVLRRVMGELSELRAPQRWPVILHTEQESRNSRLIPA